MTDIVLGARDRVLQIGAGLWAREQVWLVSAAILLGLIVLAPRRGWRASPSSRGTSSTSLPS